MQSDRAPPGAGPSEKERSIMNRMKSSLVALAVAAALGTGAAQAQISDGVVKVGVLSDM